MNQLAAVVVLASLASQHPSPFAAVPGTRQFLAPQVQMQQLGQMCITRVGSCRIPPRPINSPCSCGANGGVVR